MDQNKSPSQEGPSFIFCLFEPERIVVKDDENDVKDPKNGGSEE